MRLCVRAYVCLIEKVMDWHYRKVNLFADHTHALRSFTTNDYSRVCIRHTVCLLFMCVGIYEYIYIYRVCKANVP